jgi:cytochrome P450
MTSTAAIPKDIAKRLTDPAAYGEHAQLHEDFKWLRANNPVGLAEVDGFEPFWAVTKSSDILEVSRQQAIFHNGDRPTVLADKATETFVRQVTGTPHLVRSLVQMDAPDHPKYRQLTQSWFLAHNIKRLEDRVRTIAREQVTRMISQYGASGECDFARDVAHTYPLRVIMEILGVPREDEPRMLKLTQELFGSQDPELNRSRSAVRDPVEIVTMLKATVADFSEYFRKITDQRRKEPRDDVATIIANGQIDGRPISDFEAMSYYIIVASAGHDTTASSTAGAMWALCENQDQLAHLKQDPSLIPGLVEEAIRWTTPVQHFMRSATADYTLRGKTIAKGDWLMLCYLSGNRDEEIFSDPYAFRVDRQPNKQIAFGYGVHSCLGQHLARLEMRVLFEELLPKLRSIELGGTPRRANSNFVGGPKSVPIRFTLN